MADEIDFDELDKAVNNLMSRTPADDSDSPAPAKKEQPKEEPKDEPVDTEKVSVDTSKAEQPVVVNVERPAPPKPAVAHPKSGRFMDMVHPSADALAPSSAPKPHAYPTHPRQAPKVDKPDDASSSNQHGETPMTPFLPDARDKVEKRPLGTTPSSTDDYKSDDNDDDLSALETNPVNSEFTKEERIASEAETLDQPLDADDFDESASRELQALEATDLDSETSHDDKKSHDEENDVDTVQYDAREHHDEKIEDKHDEKHNEKHEEKSSADDSDEKTGDIYDVNDYHAPVSPVVKRRSGWGTVFIIILIIIVAIALAAAAYYIIGVGL